MLLVQSERTIHTPFGISLGNRDDVVLRISLEFP